MSTQVFSAIAMDTPVLTPGWTVQNSGTGSNQSLTENAGPGPNSGTAIGYTQVTPPTPTGTEATDIAAIITKLTTAGIFS